MATPPPSSRTTTLLHDGEDDKTTMAMAAAATTINEPLVSPLEVGFTSLLQQLRGSALDLTPVTKKYRAFRRVRGDGNCFFRSFMFRLAELCLEDHGIHLLRIQTFMKASMTDLLLPAAYEKVAVETFYEMVCEFWEEDLPLLKSKLELEPIFTDFNSSEHLVWFARVLAAAYLKRNAERFEPFLPSPYTSIHAYCSSEVEPQGKECEELEINALCDVLAWPVVVEYISAKTQTTSTFGPAVTADGPPPIALLYRPGHYDILYS